MLFPKDLEIWFRITFAVSNFVKDTKVATVILQCYKDGH